MTPLLGKPAKVDREGERLYFYAPGECCVDITSGTPENRARVMALLENAQALAQLAMNSAAVTCDTSTGPLDTCGTSGIPQEERCGTCQARHVLRAAGLLEGGG